MGHPNFNSGNKGFGMMSTSSRGNLIMLYIVIFKGNYSQHGAGSAENSAERSEISSLNKRSMFSQNDSQTTKTSQNTHLDFRNMHNQNHHFGGHGNMAMMPPPPKRV
jgi:hypothetical protein